MITLLAQKGSRARRNPSPKLALTAPACPDADVRAGPSETLVKVGAYHGRAADGTGIVGVFNLAEREVAEVLPLAGFPGVVAGEGRRYVVRAHGTGRVTVDTARAGSRCRRNCLGKSVHRSLIAICGPFARREDWVQCCQLSVASEGIDVFEVLTCTHSCSLVVVDCLFREAVAQVPPVTPSTAPEHVGIEDF